MGLIKIGQKASHILQKLIVLDDGKPLDFANYKLFRDLLDLPPQQRLTFYCGRQVGKSVFLATKLIQYSFIPRFRQAYIAPTDRQLKEFSRKKLGAFLSFSPTLRQLLMSTKSILVPPGLDLKSTDLTNDVYSKIYSTGATLTLGFAADATGVERLRGISADALAMDEAQSMDLEAVLGVLKPVLASSDYGHLFFTGTPIDKEDPLSQQFSNTTQHTLLVKCDSCNKYNDLKSLDMIQDKGIVCLKCGSRLDIRKGFFHPMNPGAPSFGVHVNRLMYPMTSENPKKFNDLLTDVRDKNSNRDTLIQEVLGVPSGEATQMISADDVFYCGVGLNYDPNNFKEAILKLKKVDTSSSLVVFSIDWGGGANPLGIAAKKGGESRTAVTLWRMWNEGGRSRMYLLYHKVFPLENPKESLDEVASMVRQLPSGTLVAADRLGGTYTNSVISNFVKERGVPIKFMTIRLGELNAIAKKSSDGMGIDISRSLLLTKFFGKVLNREIILPKAPALLEEVKNHFLSEIEFVNELDKRLWRKKSGGVDDLLFASLFAWVGFCFMYNQPEIMK